MSHQKALAGYTSQQSNSDHPLEDIIEKFHKAKEEKFKPKNRNIYASSTVTTPVSNAKSEQGKITPKTVSSSEDDYNPQRPLSAHQHKAEEVPHMHHGRRRMTLPSLFHPITPLPVQSETAKSLEKLAHDVEEITAHEGRRRHSVAHVIDEYSKHDLEHLSKIHEMQLEEMNEAKKKQETPQIKISEEEEELPRWLNGEDLHAFYHMWENKDSASKKQSQTKTRLPLPHEDADYERPRMFSF